MVKRRDGRTIHLKHFIAIIKESNCLNVGGRSEAISATKRLSPQGALLKRPRLIICPARNNWPARRFLSNSTQLAAGSSAK
jgi:hypothetical protein